MHKLAKSICLFVLGLWLLLGWGPASAQAPILPHAFYGAVQIMGQPAAAGSVVEARGVGVRTGIAANPVTVVQAGLYGAEEALASKLVVQGDVADGTPIEFYVDGMQAHCAEPGGLWRESFPFAAGGVTRLNLWVGVPPTHHLFLPSVPGGSASIIDLH